MRRRRLPARVTEVYWFIRDHIEQHGIAPAPKEIAHPFGFGRRWAESRIAWLTALKFITRTPRKHCSERIIHHFCADCGCEITIDNAVLRVDRGRLQLLKTRCITCERKRVALAKQAYRLKHLETERRRSLRYYHQGGGKKRRRQRMGWVRRYRMKPETIERRRKMRLNRLRIRSITERK